MTTPLVPTLTDDQVAELPPVIIRYGIPVHEVIGRSREVLVNALPQRLGITLKGGRVAVRVRP